MRGSRLLLILATTLIALPTAPATRGARPAPLLEEVQTHLDEAKKHQANGAQDMAVAHADMVLLSDDVAVYAKFENVPPAQMEISEKALNRALDTWATSLRDTIEFRVVKHEKDANVVVRFKPDVRMGREPVAGFANWKRIIKTDTAGKVTSAEFSADLQIRTMDLNFQPMEEEAIQHEVMHEMGHVLGLEDCDDSHNLMGPLDLKRPVSGPRPHEAQAVWDLRDQARRIRSSAALIARRG